MRKPYPALQTVVITALAFMWMPALGQVSQTASCGELYKSAPGLTNDHLSRLPDSFSPPTKGPYEKQSEFQRRGDLARLEHEEQGRKAAAQIPQTLVFTTSALLPEYDADKEILKDRFLIGERTVVIDGKKLKLALALKRDGEPTTRALGLGATKETTRYIGVVFRTKLRDAALWPQSGLKVRMKRDVARAANGNIALAIAGKLIAPWVFHNYNESTDWAAVKASVSSGHYAVMEVTCAALIDLRTKNVIHEFK